MKNVKTPGMVSRHPLATPGIFYNFPPPEIHAAPFICCSHTKIDCFDMWLIFGVAEMWLIFCVRLKSTCLYLVKAANAFYGLLLTTLLLHLIKILLL